MDTNKRTILGKQCAVCFSYNIPVRLNHHAGDIPYSPLAAYFIVGIKEGVNPERIGWHLTLKNIILPVYNPAVHRNLALLTDSELGLHPASNRREIGYYGDNLLPEWATIAYASDKETGTLGGVLLRACHNAATAVIEEMRKRPTPFEKIGNGDKNFEGYCQVEFQRE